MEDLWGELSKFGNLPVGKRQIDLKQSLKDWYVYNLQIIYFLRLKKTLSFNIFTRHKVYLSKIA